MILVVIEAEAYKSFRRINVPPMIWADFELVRMPVNLLADAAEVAANQNVFIGLVIGGTIGPTLYLVAIYLRHDSPWWVKWLVGISLLCVFAELFVLSWQLDVGLAVWATSVGIAALFTSLSVLAAKLFQLRVLRIRIGSKKFTVDRRADFNDQQLREIVAATEEVRNARKTDTSNN